MTEHRKQKQEVKHSLKSIRTSIWQKYWNDHTGNFFKTMTDMLMTPMQNIDTTKNK